MRPSLPALTSLRFFAALMVVASHLEFLKHNSIPTVRWIALNIFEEGYIGVTFFFILSGFILANRYSPTFATGTASRRRFYAARFARVMPLHLLTMAFSLPVILIGTSQAMDTHFLVKLFTNAALLQSFIPDPDWYFSFNSPAWSLSVELLFYAAFPLLIVLKSRHLILLAIAVVVAKIVLAQAMDTGHQHFLQYIFPPLRLADFVAGILLYRVFHVCKAKNVRSASQLQVATVALLLGAVGIGFFLPQWARFDIWYIGPMAAVIYSFAHSDGVFARMVSGRTMILLGESSFALYLIHQLVMRYGERVISHAAIARSGAVDLMISAAYLTVSIVVSVCLFKYFETRAKDWTLDRLRAAPPASLRADRA